MNQLPWNIPGGQQVQFTPYQIGGRNGATAEVIGNGAIQSYNYAASSAGWRINGSGSVEFEDGLFRGDISGASGAFSGTISATNITAGNLASDVINTGSLNADNISAGTVTGIAINNGAGTFQVDAAGNLTATSGTFSATVSAASFQGANSMPDSASHTLRSGDYSAGVAGWSIDGDGDAEFNNITARGTIETASSGTRITFGSLGNDEISFYSATETYPGALEVGASKVTLYVPSDTNSSGHGPAVAVFGEAGASLWMDTGVLAINNDYTSFSGSIVGFANISDDATEMYSYYGSTWAGRLRVGRGSGGAWGTLVSHSANIHTTYLGLFHSDLSDACLIMSDGTDTYIASDDEIIFRDGGTNIAKFNTSNELEIYNYPQVGTTAYPGTAGNDGSYYYSMALDYGGTYGGIEWTRSPDGTVTVIGLVKANSSTIVNGNAFLLAPTWARTGTQRVLMGLSNAGGTEAAQRYDFHTNGQLVYKGGTTIANGQFLAIDFTFHSNT